MFKRNCVVKYVDSFGVEHAAKVEAESLFELLSVVSTDWIQVSGQKTMCLTGCPSRLRSTRRPTNSFSSANEL